MQSYVTVKLYINPEANITLEKLEQIRNDFEIVTDIIVTHASHGFHFDGRTYHKFFKMSDVDAFGQRWHDILARVIVAVWELSDEGAALNYNQEVCDADHSEDGG